MNFHTQALGTWRGHPPYLNSPCADSECRSKTKKYIRTGGQAPLFFLAPGGPSRQLPQHPQRRNVPCLTWARAVAWRCCGCCGTLQGAPPPGGRRGRGVADPAGATSGGQVVRRRSDRRRAMAPLLTSTPCPPADHYRGRAGAQPPRGSPVATTHLAGRPYQGHVGQLQKCNDQSSWFTFVGRPVQPR